VDTQIFELARVVITFNIAILEKVGMVFDVIGPNDVIDIVC